VIHALAPAGRARLRQFLARRPLLTFDIDGTLAPIVARPDDARVPDAVQEVLADLAQRCEVAILTGRSRADARRMLAFAPTYVLGNHGIEGLPGGEARMDELSRITAAWHAALDNARDGSLAEAGITLEDKRYSLSLHYRHAPDHAAAQRVIATRVMTLAPPAHVVAGKCVINLLPPGAPTKGEALRELLTGVPCGCAIYAGDDETDEHVFDLPDELVLGVRVGHSDTTQAALYVDEPEEMLQVVELMREVLSGA
jgi:trehalose 6-phosphate phosphatase